MQQKTNGASRGFSLFELIIAMGLGVVVLSGALVLTSQAVGISDMVTQRSEMQQNGRVAINLMARDLSIAGTGFPSDGIQLPSGAGSQDSFFACDAAGCYVTNNVYTDERLYAVMPGDGSGPTINGVATDVVTLVYDDTTSNLDQFPLTDIDALGKSITFDAGTTPAYNDPVVGLTVGDVLLVYNGNGQAVGEVTDVDAGGVVGFSPGVGNGELRFNQAGAPVGTVNKMIHPPGPPTFLESRTRRIYIITYYLDASDPNVPMLMRQEGAHSPVALAENIEDLQITYDIFNDVTEVSTANLADAGGTPTLIRKINITITVRSARESLLDRETQRVTLTTAVSPRNLTFRDRYE